LAEADLLAEADPILWALDVSDGGATGLGCDVHAPCLTHTADHFIQSVSGVGGGKGLTLWITAGADAKRFVENHGVQVWQTHYRLYGAV
jgi:hypothetical protein